MVISNARSTPHGLPRTVRFFNTGVKYPQCRQTLQPWLAALIRFPADANSCGTIAIDIDADGTTLEAGSEEVLLIVT